MTRTLAATGTRVRLRKVAWAGAVRHCLWIGARETVAGKAALAARFLTFALIIAIWASLWRIVPPEALARAHLSYEQVVWYFALTEIVVFSLGHAYWQVEDDLLSGRLTHALVRPVSYATLVVSEELGRVAVKVIGFGVPTVGLAFVLTGAIPFGPGVLLPLIVMVFFGGALFLAVQVLVGLTTAWVGSARAVFFITQKFVFVLGGLIVPLTACPPALQRIAWATPFPAMLYAPASLMLDPSFGHIAAMLEIQVAWLCAGVAAITILGAAFERRILAKGLV